MMKTRYKLSRDVALVYVNLVSRTTAENYTMNSTFRKGYSQIYTLHSEHDGFFYERQADLEIFSPIMRLNGQKIQS